jgi:hypothetical protein
MDGCPCVLMAKKRCHHNSSHSTLLSRDHWMDGWMDEWMPLCFNWRGACLIKLDIVLRRVIFYIHSRFLERIYS